MHSLECSEHTEAVYKELREAGLAKTAGSTASLWALMDGAGDGSSYLLINYCIFLYTISPFDLFFIAGESNCVSN